MRILIISTVGLIYDGITSVITSYLKAMDKSGLEIFVAGTIEVKPSIKTLIEELGCTIIELPNRRTETIDYAISLAKCIRKNKIEVVHAHGNSGTLAIEMCAAWLGGCKKRIAHSHNTRCDQVKADKVLRPIFNLFYTDALACGEAAGKWLFKDRLFFVLTNGRDVRQFCYDQNIRNVVRNEYHIAEDELAIGHVGGFVEQKNHKFLVEIYREIKKIEPKTHFFMIGEGPLKNEVEQKCDGLNIVFTGGTNRVSEYLNAMDGMVLPSLFEGLPLVAIEWQINGLPCVLSDYVTKDCIITEGVEVLYLNDSPAKWAEVLLNSIRKRDRKVDASKAILSVREAGFDIEESAHKLKNIYFGGIK